MMSSATAVAAIAPHNAESFSSLVAQAAQAQHDHIPVVEKHHGLAEKLHGLTEKLHNLGHHRSDSDSSFRNRSGKYFYFFSSFTTTCMVVDGTSQLPRKFSSST